MFKLILVCALIAFVAAGDERSAVVESASSDVRADGFDYALDTSNNIHTVSSGDESGNVHGEFGWISPEGEHVDIKYVANENGYQPQGTWVPTPPPIPAYVLRAIAYIEAHPSKDNY